MRKRICLVAATALLSCGVAFGDFSYEQTSKITGGAIMGMVKVMGVFSKQLREPMKVTIMVKGDRLATVMPQQTQVIDLGKETMTEINYEKKTFSVVPFADWAAAMTQLESKMKSDKGEVREIEFKASVDPTGETKQINGMNAKRTVIRLEFIGTNDKGEKGTFMTMVADSWLAPDVAGYAEVRNFYQRMAQKLSWAPNSGMLSAMAPGSSKGMAELAKEFSKLEGVPVLQFTKMIGGTPEQAQAAAQQQQAQAQQEQPKDTNIEVEKPSVGGTLGRLGGRLGGLGGLGRRKKQEQQEQPAQSGGEAASGQPAGTPGSFMEMSTELTGFSQGAVDASKFDVPAGFKQVESETIKAMKRR